MVVAGPLWAGGLPGGGVDLHLACYSFTLDNGLRVVLHEDHRSPRIALHLLVHAGAASDPVGQDGVAHLLEHLMFSGSPLVPPGAFDDWLAQAGGDSNAWTGRDLTAYTMVFPREALELALSLEADRLGGLTQVLDPARLELQRRVVGNEQDRGWDPPHGRDAWALATTLYGAQHPYGRAVLGSPRSLASLDVADVVEYFRAAYAPANCSLVLAGDLDLVRAEGAVRRWFGGLDPAPVLADPEAVLPAFHQEQRRVFRDSVADAALYLGWRTVPQGHPDEAALLVASELLTSGVGSRLHDALRPGGRRVARVDSWSDNGALAGEFVIHVSVMHGSLRAVLRRVDGALRRLERDGPDPAELERFRARWQGVWLRSLESLEQRAEYLNR